jgi:hypothetical protein
MILAPSLVAAALAAVYLVWEPPSADLAAQTFRTELFEEHGFLLWSNAWYAGHHVPGYSLLSPPLGAAIGVRLMGALAAVAASVLFALLARRRYGDQALLGSLWFGAGTATMLFTGRLTFALGVAIGLAALLALQRRRPLVAGSLAALSTFGSPVAGLFTGLAGVAVALAGERRGGAAVAFGAGGALAALAVAFPTEGSHVFVVSSFLAIPIFAIAAFVLLPRDERALRIGVAIYGVLAVAVFAFDNPVGGNLARLGALCGGPVAALALAGRRPLILAAVALPLVYWQWQPAILDLDDALGDPSVERSYHEPLIAELQRRAGDEPVRVEIPPTRNRWEAVYVADRFPLARGWLRQLESDDFDLFDDGNLTPEAYRAWLAERAVRYVAVSDADYDFLAEDELDLIAGGLPFLRPLWRNEHWRLFEVEDATSLVSPEVAGARVSELDPDAFRLELGRAGSYLVRVHHTGYWTVTEGDACVSRDGEWTRVEARRPGPVRVEARFSLAGALGRDEQCSP